MTAFYAPAMPIAMLFQMVGLALIYWADKYFLLRKQVQPGSMGSSLNEGMTDLLEYCAFFYALGNLVFSITLIDSDENEALQDGFHLLIVALALSLANAFMPMESINEYFFPIEANIQEDMKFKKARLGYFLTDYDIENPITRQEAIKEFLLMIKLKK